MLHARAKLTTFPVVLVVDTVGTYVAFFCLWRPVFTTLCRLGVARSELASENNLSVIHSMIWSLSLPLTSISDSCMLSLALGSRLIYPSPLLFAGFCSRPRRDSAGRTRNLLCRAILLEFFMFMSRSDSVVNVLMAYIVNTGGLVV
jgi:hypothetical protein